MRYILSKVLIYVLISFILIGTLCKQANLRSPLDQNNLQFRNYTSPGMSPEMVEDYIETINSAYHFFADDILSTTLWIQNQLSHKYGKKYSVIIITEYVPSGGWQLWRQSYVQWTWVNKAEPYWLYLIYVSYWDLDYLESTYVNSFIAGSGIDAAKQTVIRNIVNINEINCQAYYGGMQGDLFKYDGQIWAIIVKSPSETRISGRFYNARNQYYSFATKNCEYLLYVIKSKS